MRKFTRTVHCWLIVLFLLQKAFKWLSYALEKISTAHSLDNTVLECHSGSGVGFGGQNSPFWENPFFKKNAWLRLSITGWKIIFLHDVIYELTLSNYLIINDMLVLDKNSNKQIHTDWGQVFSLRDKSVFFYNLFPNICK